MYKSDKKHSPLTSGSKNWKQYAKQPAWKWIAKQPTVVRNFIKQDGDSFDENGFDESGYVCFDSLSSYLEFIQLENPAVLIAKFQPTEKLTTESMVYILHSYRWAYAAQYTFFLDTESGAEYWIFAHEVEDIRMIVEQRRRVESYYRS